MATKSPFQLSSTQGQAAAPAPAPPAATQAQDVKGAAKEQPTMDLYRTFSPSEVAFWDLRCAPNKCASNNEASNASTGSWSNWFLGGMFGK